VSLVARSAKKKQPKMIVTQICAFVCSISSLVILFTKHHGANRRRKKLESKGRREEKIMIYDPEMETPR
jgi:hypothetical protein